MATKHRIHVHAYRPYVAVDPLQLGPRRRDRKLAWNALRGLAHGVAGRRAISGLSDVIFISTPRVKWTFPNAASAIDFQQTASAMLRGLGVSGAVRRVRV